jgi:hypothetical protein
VLQSEGAGQKVAASSLACLVWLMAGLVRVVSLHGGHWSGEDTADPLR